MITILTIFSVADASAGVAAVMDHCKSLPSRFDVRQACEKAKTDRITPPYAAQWDARSRAQLAERERLEAEAKAEPPEVRQRVADEFRAFLRAQGLALASDRKRHNETPATVMARHGLSQADWDAIPDQPTNPAYWEGQR